MMGFSSPFGGDDGHFDAYDEFVPENLPDPGPFLEPASVLSGEAHVAFHRATRDVFEERTVYDMTFGYNLARLNLDTRHPNAGYRYAEADGDDAVDGGDATDGGDSTAEDAGDGAVLRAEFTPTTPFCPQSQTLAVGSFRAWNGLSDRHEYDLVRVRVHPMHHEAKAINRRLTELESTFRKTGVVPEGDDQSDGPGPTDRAGSAGRPSRERRENEEAGYGPQAPF
jgi:hypothetical protein